MTKSHDTDKIEQQVAVEKLCDNYLEHLENEYRIAMASIAKELNLAEFPLFSAEHKNQLQDEGIVVSLESLDELIAGHFNSNPDHVAENTKIFCEVLYLALKGYYGREDKESTSDEVVPKQIYMLQPLMTKILISKTVASLNSKDPDKCKDYIAKQHDLLSKHRNDSAFDQFIRALARVLSLGLYSGKSEGEKFSDKIQNKINYRM